MKEEVLTILGNDKNFNGIAYVCYLDILGFSKDVCDNWGKSSNPLDKILSIKNEILKMKEDDNLKDSDATIFAPSVKTVSDSITICFGFESEDYVRVSSLNYICGLRTILKGISIAWSTAIKNGYTIRGAIDIGKVYWNENELIGPAFITAYNLESKVAKNSRIIISSEMNKQFYASVKYNKDYFDEFISKKFRKDVDGYIIVDPNIMYDSNTERNELIEKLKEIRDATSGIVREKYNPLIYMLSEGKIIGLKDSDIVLR
jgi:hypothetical protein